MILLPHEIELSERFSDIIRDWLTADELADVNSKNNADEDHCATHEYCDANEAMQQAFLASRGVSIDVQNEEHIELINRAWKRSKKNKFKN